MDLVIPAVLTQRLDWTIRHTPLLPEHILAAFDELRYLDFPMDWRRAISGKVGYRPGGHVMSVRGDMHFDVQEITLYHEVGHIVYESSYSHHSRLLRARRGRGNRELEHLLDLEAMRFRRAHREFSRSLLLNLLGARTTRVLHYLPDTPEERWLLHEHVVTQDALRAITAAHRRAA